MGDGDLASTRRPVRIWVSLATAGLLGLIGVAAASGSWRADEPRISPTQSIASSSLPTLAPTPTATPSAGPSTIDVFGPTCDRVAESLGSSNGGTLPYWGRQQVTDCLIARLEGGDQSGEVITTLPPDLTNYSGSLVSSDGKRVVIVSEGPLPTSALLRLGPIPPGFTLQQRTNGLRATRVAALQDELEQRLRRTFDAPLSVSVSLSIDGRTAEIYLKDERLPCTGYDDDPTPAPADVAKVDAAAREFAPSLDIRVFGTQACLRFAAL